MFEFVHKLRHAASSAVELKRSGVSRLRIGIILIATVTTLSIITAFPAQAAIVTRSATSANNAGGATTLSINTPAGASVGDVLILSVTARGTTLANIEAGGWTQLQQHGTAGVFRTATFYAVLSATPPASYLVRFADSSDISVTSKAAGGIIAYSGVDTANPINISGGQLNASNTTATAPSIQTTVSNAMLVATYGTATGTTTTPGSSMTEQFDNASTGGGAGTRSTAAGQDAVQISAGFSGTKTMLFGAAAANVGHIVALRPAPPSTITQTAYRWFSNVDAANFSTITNNPTTAADATYAATNDSSFVYTTGYVGTNGNGWRIEKRKLTDGALVAGFGTGGVVDPTISANDDRAWGIDQDANNIYVVGQDATVSTTNLQWRIEKRDKTTGALVNGFGTNGVAQSNPTVGIDTPKEVKVDSSFIYIAGVDDTGSGAWRIEKRDITTGALVAGFGTNGAVVTDYQATENDEIAAMVIDTNNIYVGGYDYSSGSVTNSQSRIEKRDKTTGALVNGFGTNGAVVENPFTGNSSSTIDDGIVHKGLLISGGNLYTAGSQGVTGATDFQWRITKRDLTTGALITGFGTNGVVNVNPSTAIDNPTAIRTDGTSLFIAGFDKAVDAAASQWRIEKRDMATGAAVSGFGTNGVILSNPSTTQDELRDLVISGDNIYPVGYDFSPGNYQMRIEKRNKQTGSGPADHGLARAAQDTAATSVAINDQVRLRMLLKVGTSPLGIADQQFKLQFAQQSGTCDIGFSGESYTDVTTTSAIAFLDNTALIDASTAYLNLSDPTDGVNSVAVQSYEEANNFTNTATIPINSNGLWDLSLYNRSSPAGTTYCFRVVGSNGTNLTSYAAMPTLTTAAPVSLGQTAHRWFQNADSVTPGVTLAAQDSAVSVEAGTPIRLRQRIAVDGAQLGASAQNFKLQYAEKAGTCSASFGSSPIFLNATGATGSENKLAGTGSTDGLGAVTVSNPEFITADDELFAQFSRKTGTSALTDYVLSTNYGFTIPTNATINGVAVSTIRSAAIPDFPGTGSVSDDSIRLIKGGTMVGTDKSIGNGWNTGGSYGSTTDLWGTGWTASDINNNQFGVAIRASIVSDGTNITTGYLDAVSITVSYSLPAGGGAIEYFNNTVTASGATVSSSGSDPTSGARTATYQTYLETDPFTNNTAIPAGNDGLWDIALTSTGSAAGKTYCLRTVRADGSALTTYSSYPEISFTSTGPTLDQQMRGGQSVINGIKTPFKL